MARGPLSDEHRRKLVEARKKLGNRSLVIAMLDSKTLLTATEHAFVIKEKVVGQSKEGVEIETWASKYYYSELGDAVRGYIKHRMRKPIELEKMDGSLKGLVDKLDEFEKLEQKIVTDLTTFWHDKIKKSHYVSVLSKNPQVDATELEKAVINE